MIIDQQRRMDLAELDDAQLLLLIKLAILKLPDSPANENPIPVFPYEVLTKAGCVWLLERWAADLEQYANHVHSGTRRAARDLATKILQPINDQLRLVGPERNRPHVAKHPVRRTRRKRKRIRHTIDVPAEQ